MSEKSSGWDLWWYAIVLCALLNVFGVCDGPEEKADKPPEPASVEQKDGDW